MPPAGLRANATLVRPLDRWLSDLVRFVARAHTADVVPPAVGARRLADALRASATLSTGPPRRTD